MIPIIITVHTNCILNYGLISTLELGNHSFLPHSLFSSDSLNPIINIRFIIIPQHDRKLDGAFINNPIKLFLKPSARD